MATLRLKQLSGAFWVYLLRQLLLFSRVFGMSFRLQVLFLAVFLAALGLAAAFWGLSLGAVRQTEVLRQSARLPASGFITLAFDSNVENSADKAVIAALEPFLADNADLLGDPVTESSQRIYVDSFGALESFAPAEY